MEMRKMEQRKLVHIFVILDQQGSQEQLKEAAINHSTPGNSPTCASPKNRGNTMSVGASSAMLHLSCSLQVGQVTTAASDITLTTEQ